MRWLELVVRVPAESHEAVAEACRQAGSQGVRLEKDSVVAYLPVTGEIEASKQFLYEQLSHLSERGLSAVQTVQEQEVDESDWAEAWKQYFHTFRIGKRVIIKPSWETAVPQGEELIVELDPGMAFGTGQHASTQLCIEFLEEIVQKNATVVDVGTGSGILAIVAAKLGAGQVWAGDNDPVAVVTAQRNVVQNRVQSVVSVHRVEGCEGVPACDVLVANITAEIIESLLPDFSRCVRPGGWLVVSGIVQERSRRICKLLSRLPWRNLMERARGEWCAFAAQRS